MQKTTTNALKSLILAPFYILSVVTGAKSFRGNSVIGSVWLNRAHLHINRIAIAHIITHFRWWLLSPLMPRSLRRSFAQDGFVAIPDFISEEDIAAIKNEISAHPGPVRQLTQGDTATQRILLDHKATRNSPALRALAKNAKLWRYLSYCGAKIMPPLLYIQRVRNGFRDKGPDPQKNMHSDTFHPTMKAWLFLEDVTAKKGPFTYARGSHRFTPERKKWEHEKALQAASGTDKYSEKGSFRVTPEQIKKMGFEAAEGVSVKAGTLVIANTNGFHGRGQAENGASRLEIWAYSRHNPFNPLPGLDFPGLRHIRNSILQSFWRMRDRKAEKRGGKASWHLIPAEKMTDGINDGMKPENK